LNVEFRSSFAKDLKRIRDRDLRRRVGEIIELVERVQSLQEVENIKKLRGGDCYYRIRVGDYRIGLLVEDDIVTFVRFLHRKDVYRYFP
jgi:mRNA interferase RelE/StbE